MDAILQDVAARKATAETAAKELAEKFGLPFTRNAVLGRAHRRGVKFISRGVISPYKLRKEGKALNRRGDRDGAARAFLKAERMPWAPAPVVGPVSAPEGGVPFDDLRAGQCRWEISPPGTLARDYRFCGAGTLPDQSWCACHQRMAFQPGTAYKGNGRRSRAAQIVWREARGL